MVARLGFGSARLGFGSAWVRLDSVRHGSARLGSAWFGVVWLDLAFGLAWVRLLWSGLDGGRERLCVRIGSKLDQIVIRFRSSADQIWV